MSSRSFENEPETGDERLRVAVERSVRRRRVRDDERRERARRRAPGLDDRHAARLADVRRRAAASRAAPDRARSSRAPAAVTCDTG